jgi:hypothetical protein
MHAMKEPMARGRLRHGARDAGGSPVRRRADPNSPRRRPLRRETGVCRTVTVGVGNARERSEQGVTGPNNDAGPFALSSLRPPGPRNHPL